MHICFYTGSLNHRATSSLPRQLESGFHYIQKFYKSHTKITLLNNKIHKIFDSHKNLDTHPTKITLADLKSHQANQSEAQEHSNLMVAIPSQPYMHKHYLLLKDKYDLMYCCQHNFHLRSKVFTSPKHIDPNHKTTSDHSTTWFQKENEIKKNQILYGSTTIKNATHFNAP